VTEHDELPRSPVLLVRLYLGVEKNGLVEQLRGWFDDLGIPVLALGGTRARLILTTSPPISVRTRIADLQC